MAKRLATAGAACSSVRCPQQGRAQARRESALLAGLEKLLAVLDPLANCDIDRIRALAKRVLPNLFDSG